jgi:hypothetical protein
MSYAGRATLFKTWQSHGVRFSFMPMVMKSPGLKPIKVQNARSSSACVPWDWLLFAGSRRSQTDGIAMSAFCPGADIANPWSHVSFVNGLCRVAQLWTKAHLFDKVSYGETK